jgi:WD40 repeat protein
METSQAGGCRLHLRKTFAAHSRRILNLIQSPDQNYLCTAGADENLKFWNLRSSDADPFRPPLPAQFHSHPHHSFRP